MISRPRVVGALAIALLASACATTGPASGSATPATSSPSEFSSSFGVSTPEAEGMDSRPLLALATAIRDAQDFPVLSILVSRHGKLVFELYTSGLSRQDAHYLMSITKSVVSALIGIAIGEHLLPDAGASLAELLPPSLFPSEAARAAFHAVTIKDVLGMSALDAPDPPRVYTKEALERLAAFQHSQNRLRFALTQAVLAHPGADFQYNDITPMLATGLLHNATHMTVLEFAAARLFEPLRFRNYEWMHQDPSSVDNGGYGLRLRPIDMQKLGVLYLRHGNWNGQQLVPRPWVDLSFSPWLTVLNSTDPNFGWFWWTHEYAPHWTAHMAVGWKGQRIAIFPDQDLVVTMTALIEDDDEEAIFTRLLRKFIIPAVAGDVPRPESSSLRSGLETELEAVRLGPTRFLPSTEWRMIPGTRPKQSRHSYVPLTAPVQTQ